MSYDGASRAQPKSAGRDGQHAIDQLTQILLAGRNADGGWGYYAGKTSRLEPTCWALLALRAHGSSPHVFDPAYAWMAAIERSTGWLLESPEWPVNIAFNALTAFTLYDHPSPASDQIQLANRLLASVIASKGLTAPKTDGTPQDNSLQGWSWIDQTFSWVEPTCWALLALKKSGVARSADAARAAGINFDAARTRVSDGERLLADRACRAGGWNFGNAVVMDQDLRPYMPVTALGLLAMQDARGADVVNRALASLEAHWSDELSAVSLGLSRICLGVYDRRAEGVAAQLIAHTENALQFGNYHGIAVALCALAPPGGSHAFTL